MRLGAELSPRRNFRSSFLCCGFVSELSGWNNLLGKRFEAWVAVQWIEKRVNSNPPNVSTGAILIALFEPAKRLLFVVEREINNGKAIRGDVALPGYLFQLVQYFQRLSLVTRGGISVTEQPEDEWVIV